MKKTDVARICSRFKDARVMVVGDLILDEFIWGDAKRISPEAPVPVVWAQSQSYMPGGASNVANNMASLGAAVDLCGMIGNDHNGAVLKGLLEERKINCIGIVADFNRPTTVKTRIIAAHQQIVRLDWEKLDHLTSKQSALLIEAVKRRIDAVDALVIEDYGKGVIHAKLLKAVIALAKKKKKVITVDPKVEHFSLYKGVTAITPNEKEAYQGAGFGHHARPVDIERIGKTLLKKLQCQGVLVTLGEKGMKLFKRGQVKSIPTLAQEVFDVSGAGDTVISVFTLALSSGAKMQEAAILANVAAGIVVGKVGVAVITKEEIVEAWERTKGKI